MFTESDQFTFQGRDLGFSVLDFWKYAYSDLNSDPRDDVAEYLVARALGLTVAYNRQDWTLFDIAYPRAKREFRIEVKSTSYFQTWRTDGKVSSQRVFSIRKSMNPTGVIERHSDIYVFCLLRGNTREEANPVKIDNWDFFIIPTYKINEQCGDNKSVSLQVVKRLSQKAFTYDEMKCEIDRIIDTILSDGKKSTV